MGNFFYIDYFSSPAKDSFLLQLQNCFKQVETLAERQKVVKVTVFFGCADTEAFNVCALLLKDTAASLPWLKAPVSLVSQPVLGRSSVSMEVWSFDQVFENVITFDHCPGGSYLHIKNQNEAWLFAGIYCSEKDTFLENSQEVFMNLDALMASSGFGFCDIIRQWNYVENITLLDEKECKELQNYQAFNNVRSQYYAKSEFKSGYPAATGIGVDCGGMLVEVIAVKKSTDMEVKGLSNPLQVDAHDYSKDVLVGDAAIKKTTPKFERAKYVGNHASGLVFVSGTASILGEKTVHIDDIENQTLTTIKNINLLVSGKNLCDSDIHLKVPLKLLNYRVYVKRPQDYDQVKTLCEKYLGKAPVIYTRADVCRDNLLVEIEAAFHSC